MVKLFDYYKAYVKAETSEEKFDIFINWMKSQGLILMFRFWEDEYEEYDKYDKEEFIYEFDNEIKKLLK